MVTTGGRDTMLAVVVGLAGQAFQHVAFRHALDHMAIFGRHQFGGVGVDNVVGRRHHAVLHQHLDDVHGAARHAVGQIGHRDGFRNDDVARTGGTGRLRLVALVDALQMALVGGDRAHALIVIGQSAGDGQLAAAAFAFGDFLGRRRLDGHQLAADLLGGAFFFFFIFQPAARRFGGRDAAGRFQTARGFLLGALLGQFVGGLAGVFLDLALFGRHAFGLHLLFFAGLRSASCSAMAARFAVRDAGIGQSRGAAGFFLVRKLAQNNAAARGRDKSWVPRPWRRLDGRARQACPRPWRRLGGHGGGGAADRFFSTTTALVRPWLKLCLTVDVSVFFSESVLPGRLVSSVSLMTYFQFCSRPLAGFR